MSMPISGARHTASACRQMGQQDVSFKYSHQHKVIIVLPMLSKKVYCSYISLIQALRMLMHPHTSASMICGYAR